MVKRNKLTPAFGSTDFTVVNRHGSDVVVESQTGQTYRRNVTHLKKVPSTEPHVDPGKSHQSLEPEVAPIENTRPKRKVAKPMRYEN